MAKPKRKPKLKVFKTPIGFHDAYVAAPSQKAALEAWGSETNLFSQGSAEQVTDEALMKVPLENPGQVVKVLRGTRAEQLAALKKQKPARPAASAKAEVLPKREKKPPPKPSRSAVIKAEEALEKVEERQTKEVDCLEEQRKAIEAKLRDTRRRHERERDRAQKALEDERSKYQAALDRYEAG